MALYKEKSKITRWLKKHQIEKYTLVQDDTYGYVVDVQGCVNLERKKLKAIPVKFNIVDADFSCSYNKLKSLVGCPHTVGGNFYCDANLLKNLEGSPKGVVGDFGCNFNQLSSLKGSPEEIADHFLCAHNQLTSLENGPKRVGGDYQCSHNHLTSLLGIAEMTERNHLDCSSNRLNKLEDLPIMGVYIHLGNNSALGVYQEINKYDDIKVILERHKLQLCVESAIPSKKYKI